MIRPYVSEEIELNPEMRSSEVADFERRLQSKIVGQDRAVSQVIKMYQIYLANMTMPGRPIGNLLFLGPTGSGKTRVVEASAEILFGSPKAFIKIDCAEFQHSHEIAKLIGSPPGYLGHRETPPLLTQEAINQYQTDKTKMSFILFDEIEKANDALWQLLLGIMDKGTLTLGDNRKIDMSRCVIFMTSNLGAVEMSDMMSSGIGFSSGAKHDDVSLAVLDQKIYRTTLEVAKRKFSPEFMNRLDKVVVFRTLTENNLRKVLDIELNEVQTRIMILHPNRQFIFRCTPEAKDFLIREGIDLKYGARHLKRAIERHLVYPLSNLIATGQVNRGDVIKVNLNKSSDKLTFARERVVAGFGQEAVQSSTAGNRKGNQVGTAVAPKLDEPTEKPRQLTFVLASGGTITVNRLLEYKNLHVGDLVRLVKTNDAGESMKVAKKIQIVGFSKDRIVIQLDDNFCAYITHGNWKEFFRVIS